MGLDRCLDVLILFPVSNYKLFDLIVEFMSSFPSRAACLSSINPFLVIAICWLRYAIDHRRRAGLKTSAFVASFVSQAPARAATLDAAAYDNRAEPDRQACAQSFFRKTLCRRAVVATIDLSAANLEFFQKHHWVSDRRNVILLQLQQQSWV